MMVRGKKELPWEAVRAKGREESTLKSWCHLDLLLGLWVHVKVKFKARRS